MCIADSRCSLIDVSAGPVMVLVSFFFVMCDPEACVRFVQQ